MLGGTVPGGWFVIHEHKLSLWSSNLSPDRVILMFLFCDGCSWTIHDWKQVNIPVPWSLDQHCRLLQLCKANEPLFLFLNFMFVQLSCCDRMHMYCFYIVVRWTDELHAKKKLFVIWVKTNRKLSDWSTLCPRKDREVLLGGRDGAEEGGNYHKHYILVKYGTGYFTFYWLWVREMFFERK